MPRRSNIFQRLIKLIETQLAPADTVITESKMVEDIFGDQREVDIHLESMFGRHKIEVAVECTDKSDSKKKVNVQDIEQLKSKYDDLPSINKIVIVSATGFTKKAIAKGAHHGIITLPIEEAEQLDWLHAVFHESVALVTRAIFFPVNAHVGVEPPDGPRPGDKAYNEDGVVVGALPDLLYQQIYLESNIKLILDPLIKGIDIKNRCFQGGAQSLVVGVDTREQLYFDPECKFRMSLLRFEFVCLFEEHVVDMKRFAYHGAQVVSGLGQVAGDELSLAVIAQPGQKPELALAVRRELGNNNIIEVGGYSQPLPKEGPIHYLAIAMGPPVKLVSA